MALITLSVLKINLMTTDDITLLLTVSVDHFYKLVIKYTVGYFCKLVVNITMTLLYNLVGGRQFFDRDSPSEKACTRTMGATAML